MDLSSRWDRFAITFLLIAIAAMTGCQGLFGGGSTQNGAVSASSTALDFGTVVVGNSKTLTDTVTNGTTTVVAINSASASDPQFRVSAPAFPLMLAPGQSAGLTIAFTPRSAGKPAGKLALMSSAITHGELDVAIGGAAVSAGKLAVNPASVTFGNVRVGQTQAQPATLTNSGQSSVTVAQASATNAAFTFSGLTLPITLAPGQSASFSVIFAPKSAGPVSANVSLNGQASLSADVASTHSDSPTTPTTAAVTVSGDGMAPGQLALSPATLSFGNVTVGTNQSQTVSVTNTGGTSASISAATASGTGFAITGLSLPLTLSPGQSATFKVTFAPAVPGVAAGGILIASNATDATLTAAITGTGVNAGALAANPTALSFGSVPVGTSQKQAGSLTNSGGTAVTVSGATASGAGFSLSGLTFPLTLSAGQSTPFTVTFAPQASGIVSGSVSFASSAAAASVVLSGSGLASGSLAANPASVNFGNVQVGSPQAQTITLTNGGSAAVTISQATASGSAFALTGLSLPATLQAGQSVSFTATFTPSANGNAAGTIAVASSASNPALNIALSGVGVTAGALAASPTSVSFGSVQVGSNQTKSEILTNSGGSSVTISNATLSGTGFSTTGLSVPLTLNGGQSVTFSISFAPQTSGSASGALALTANGSVPSLNLALSGSGTAPGQLSITPATVSFGSVTVGASQNQTGTLAATGSSVIVSSAVSNNGEFSLSGLALPVTLNAGQSANYTLTFTPQASGAAAGSISFASNATNGTVSETLSGTGTPAPQHTVSLSWAASTSTVAGYNVYRGSQSGGPYAAISVGGGTGTTYADSSVSAGQTYFYVVTAVDGSGNESVYSNQAQAIVPTP